MDTRELDSFVFEKMQVSGLPGLSIALVQGDELIYSRGYGQRDLEYGLPATPDTLYSIGSVTKSFTALAIMQLAERGSIDPSDPVSRYLPYPFKPKGEEVRLEHLMTHTSGIPALAYSEALIAHANGTGGGWLPISGPEDVLTFMSGSDEWTESRPGERWAYANEGYALLGLIVEKVSGLSYAQYLRENVLRPLGMTRSFLDKAEVEADGDAAIPYVLEQGGGRPQPGHYLYRRIRSEGGLISSVTDLARYLGMYLNWGGDIATRSTVEEMMRPRVASAHRTAPELFAAGIDAEPAQHYGLGLAVETLHGRRMVGHGGSVLVSTAHLAFLPDQRLGVAVLANGSGYPLAHFARYALSLLLGEDPHALPALRLQAALSNLAGRYATFRGTMEALVKRRGDFLVLHLPDRAKPQEIILVPQDLSGDETRFFTLSEGRRLPVYFRVDGNEVELLYERHKFRRVGPAS